MKKYKFPF